MSHSGDAKREELADRLMEQALREVLAGERPPDLSDKILAAVEKQELVSPQRKEHRMDRSKLRFRRALYGLATCLVVGIGMALMVAGTQHFQLASKLARPNAARDEDGSTRPTERLPGIVSYHVSSSATSREQSPGYPASSPSQPSQPLSRSDAFSTAAPKRRANAARPAPASPPTNETPLLARTEASEKRKNLPSAYYIEDDVQYPAATGKPTGQGPGLGGDRYDHLVENDFLAVKDHPLSTFSVDVDTASYANVRRFLLQDGQLPPPDAVRIEELVNYFDYDYSGPEGDVPFAAHMAVASCPWQPEHRLVRIGLKGKEIAEKDRPASNLVFLLDVSGSMDSPEKLPLLKAGMKLLAEKVRPIDRVAIAVYASSEGLVLPSTSGEERERIVAALEQLRAGSSTNGGVGIQLAYKIAQENFISKGVNRVILCTDGDFNVGTTSSGDLTRMVEEKARSGVFLSVLGFGRGNLNDAMMKTISNKGNGNYAYIDSLSEARKVLVQQMGGTLVTIAKDVKIQVEFNPARVAAYRLIGYEDRLLAAEDFNNDRKDAGEIGAGHMVTALYELVPAGKAVNVAPVDPLKYQAAAQAKEGKGASDDLLTLKLRYKTPDGNTSKRLEYPLVDRGTAFRQAGADFQFAAAVASFGMLLRNSQYKGSATYDGVLEMAEAAKGSDPHGYREEFLQMVQRAKKLTGR